MADKLRSTFPISVSFSTGELPDSTKLNGLASQAKQGLGIVEHALGDLWNQAGDSVLQSASGAPLMIPNLARLLGASRLANPRIPYLPNIEEYTHVLSGEAQNYEFRLPFPPASGSGYTWSGTSAPSGAPQANKEDVDASGEWWIDTNTGQVFTYTAVQADWKLTYKPIVDCDLGNNATWNVIPDPDTDSSYGFGGVKIEYKNGTDDAEGYLVFLPPRGPLDARRIAQSAQDDAHTPSHTDNFQVAPLSSNNRRFWQADAADADTSSNAEHYRYVLPKLLTDNWSQAATIPTGFIYLYDPINTKTIIEGLVYSAENAGTPRKWVFAVSGSNLTNWLNGEGSGTYTQAMLQATGSHGSSYYPANGLRVITVGVSVADALAAIAQHFYNHDHSSVVTDEAADTMYPVGRPVKHSLLTGLSKWGDISALDNDDHPQYLHRNAGSSRDKYGNALLDDLRLASTDSTSDYNNLNTQSRQLRFGSDAGPGLQFDNSVGGPGNGTLAKTCLNLGLGAGYPSIAYQGIDGSGNTLGEVWASTFRDTPYYTGSTYGFSAGTAADGYGPIRKHVLQGNKFYYWTDEVDASYGSNSILEYTDDQPSLVVQGGGVVAPSHFGFRVNYASLGYYRWYMAPVVVPHEEFCIVQVRLRIYPLTQPLPSGKMFIMLVRSEPTTSTHVGAASADVALNVFGGAPVGTGVWTIWSDMFTASATSPLCTVSQGEQVSIVFRLGPNADPNTIYVDSPVVYYRVKEF